MKRIAFTGGVTAILLAALTRSTVSRCPRSRPPPYALRVVGSSRPSEIVSLLLRGQLDVLRPLVS
jgi:hypothetical protein